MCQAARVLVVYDWETGNVPPWSKCHPVLQCQAALMWPHSKTLKFSSPDFLVKVLGIHIKRGCPLWIIYCKMTVVVRLIRFFLGRKFDKPTEIKKHRAQCLVQQFCPLFTLSFNKATFTSWKTNNTHPHFIEVTHDTRTYTLHIPLS